MDTTSSPRRNPYSLILPKGTDRGSRAAYEVHGYCIGSIMRLRNPKYCSLTRYQLKDTSRCRGAEEIALKQLGPIKKQFQIDIFLPKHLSRLEVIVPDIRRRLFIYKVPI